jgi:hypothetical protein
MLYGIQHGIGATTLSTGNPGLLSTTITITVIIIITMIITTLTIITQNRQDMQGITTTTTIM